MRTKRALLNIGISLILEIVTIVYGFVVPRLFIGHFGSEVNGLVNSISNFIGYITLLQSGVGSVIKASLYKPLAQRDKMKISVIVKTSSRFFNKIARVTVVYIAILMCFYPIFVSDSFGWLYTASLIVVLGIGTCAQYFFGITYQMVLEADQRAYVYSIVQIISIAVNTFLSVFLIKSGCSVHIVKIANAVVYVARPLLTGLYVKKKYCIDSNAEADSSLIKQRWDGFIQAIAYFIHSKTDVFVLTIFSTLSDVSVYSIYTLVTGGLTAVLTAIDKAVRSSFGNIIACGEKENLQKTFSAYNNLIHIFSTICFATAGITIYNFINIYIKGISDTEYIRYIFGFLIITAEYIYCLRMPYNSIIFAAGKFKETKISAGIEALINIILSCLLVPRFGLSGVAVGTLVAMCYRTICFAYFLKTNIVFLSIRTQARMFFSSFLAYGVSIAVLSRIHIVTPTYLSWIPYALLVFVGVCAITSAVNGVFNYKNTKESIRMIVARLNRRK